MGTGKYNAGDNPAMDWHPIQGETDLIHLIPKWRRPRMVWVELHENEASRATEYNTPNGVLSRQSCVWSFVFYGGRHSWQFTQRTRYESIEEF